jgi:hypothetical protein
LAEAGSVVAVTVLGAVIEACAHVTGISRPARVAVALALHTLSIAAAALTMARAASSTVCTTPSILARANTAEALSVARAIVGASLLGAVISLVALIALACHFSSHRNTLSISRA